MPKANPILNTVQDCEIARQEIGQLHTQFLKSANLSQGDVFRLLELASYAVTGLEFELHNKFVRSLPPAEQEQWHHDWHQYIIRRGPNPHLSAVERE